jgi:threonylcarbamoyladenosine tRNA methylthiotransferase MtaB
MRGDINGRTKRERARILRELGNEKKKAYIEKNIGRELTVLTESFSDNMLSGKSENYLTIYLPGDKSEINRFMTVRIERQFRDGVYGERVV